MNKINMKFKVINQKIYLDKSVFDKEYENKQTKERYAKIISKEFDTMNELHIILESLAIDLICHENKNRLIHNYSETDKVKLIDSFSIDIVERLG